MCSDLEAAPEGSIIVLHGELSLLPLLLHVVGPGLLKTTLASKLSLVK